MDITIDNLGTFLLAFINIAASVYAAGHAMLTKDDVRAATGWVGLILLVPFIGWLTYLLFGINRIQRRAQELRGGRKPDHPALESGGIARLIPSPATSTRDLIAIEQLAKLSLQVTPTQFDTDNQFTVLENGDQAYPEMIAAIDGAQKSLALSTYIFNNDKAGLRFLDAFERAQARGVRIRILIDGVGAWYSRPSMFRLLQAKGLNCERFLHSFLPWEMPYLNMRNHQKIMVADGRIGFTGSMNIAEGNLIADRPRRPILDHHFKVEGPVVRQLMEAFAHEWNFTNGEILTGPDWFPDLDPKGSIIARGIPAGPDLDENPIRWTLLAALSQARERIRIVTPYFLPDITMRTGLLLAAMRGVAVDIMMPEHNNLAFVKWASTPQLAELIAAGCRVWMSPGPFAHTKLMTVDGIWSTLGSANWDPRSLRLNFEFNMECYGADLTLDLDRLIDARLAASRAVASADIASRSLPIRLRDSAAWLFSPYL